MTLTRKPAIATPREADRGTRNAVDAIRARLEAIEGLLNTVELMAKVSGQSNTAVTASLNNLQSQINQITNSIDALDALLASDDGIVVLTSGTLITRELQAGDGISITNPDGVDGNPTISTINSGCCYPFLTTELDDDVLTEDGHRIRVE